MSQDSRSEWLATYHEGDSRLQNKRHGILQLNREKQQIEFAVQPAEKSPIIVVSYPLLYLRDVKILGKRPKMRKRSYLQFFMGDPPNEMTPLFSFSLEDVETVKNEIQTFQEEIQASQQDQIELNKKSEAEADLVEVFARLLRTPIEQFQQLFEGFTSRLRVLTTPSKKVTKAIISSIEPDYPYEIREIELNERKFLYYGTSFAHSDALILLSPIGGRIEDYYPMISSLLGKYQIYILGLRGYVGSIAQDKEFKLKDYIKDLKDFLEYVGPDKEITLGAHSLFSVILLEEFLDQHYSNVKKIVLISGSHRAPDTFRKGVKALPPTPAWSPFKGQVRKIAPKILFSKNTDKEVVIDPFIQYALSIPDKVYYEIFKDFLPRYDYSKAFKSLTKPVLTIWGKNDQIISSDLKKEMIDITPPSLLTYKELPGGHMVLLEEPNKVGREINNFITNKKWSQIEIE
jgi:pimeloyl-ACP methyl ester carboxylesterase